MKELSIEQKARAYDEAFKIAKKNYDTAQDLCNGSQIGVECFKNTLVNIFPELKESKENEDEKIRKAIMACCSDHGHKYQYTGIAAQDMLHWLEKQGNKSVNIDIESMVSSYKQRLKSQEGIENNLIVNMCLTAFRHGVENVLEELNLKKLEKQSEQKPFDYENANIQQKDFAQKVEPKFHEGEWVTIKE